MDEKGRGIEAAAALCVTYSSRPLGGKKTAILALFKWHCVCNGVFGFQDKVVKN